MISITLPDNSIKQFKMPPTGMQVAISISRGLAHNCVALKVDNILKDLSFPVESDAAVRLITTKDPEALTIMRHSAAHVMAQAILNIYPSAKLTIGPVVEDGFYYDIDMQPISEEDFPKIEAEMKKLSKPNYPLSEEKFPKPRHWISIMTNPIN